MATYYADSGNQRDAVSMLCLRENLPNPYPETPVLSSNKALYMNSGSYSDALSGNSQQPNNCFEIPSIGASHSTSEQPEILGNFGGLQTGDHDLSAWREGRNEILVTHQVEGQNFQGQGLSLSLGTQIPPIHDRNSDPNFGLVLGLNRSISGDGAYRSGSSGDEHLRHTNILSASLPESNQDMNRGDFSILGMSSVARTIPYSKYLKAAQQLLDEVVDLRKAIKRPDISEKCSKEDDGKQENQTAPSNGLLSSQDSFGNASCQLSHAESQDLRNKLMKLLSMLDEVDSRYKQYCHQMQFVVSSFDAIAGCGAAKPYTAIALQTISRHFRCLCDAITGQISAIQKNLGEQDASGNNNGVGIMRLRFVDQQLRQQRALQQLGMMQHAWRPQRGLPDSSVSILRAWLFEHFLHPYPKDSEKIMLARQTGLTRSQVSNWFINARVRLWKPMIEKMYKEEFGDADMDSSSSSENASKTTKSDPKTSDDVGDDFQRHQSSMDNKNCNVEQAKDFGSNHVLDAEMVEPSRIVGLHNRGLSDEPGYGLVKQTGEQMPNFDDCSLFPDNTGNDRLAPVAPTCQISELGRFETGNGVSLTLGLQHCEGGNFMSGETHYGFVAMREDDIYNAAGAVASGGAVSSAGAEPAELDCIGAGNQQQRYSSSHLVHDFVV